MENSLKKIAEQLNSFDEASLTGLWEKYHDIVKEFEPTKRWEEAALILSMIQALRWKNQLFNTKWSELETPWSQESEDESAENGSETENGGSSENKQPGERGKVIPFWQKKDDQE